MKTQESGSPHGIPQKNHMHVKYKYTRHRLRSWGWCLQSFQRVHTYKSHKFLDGRHCYQSQFLHSTKTETLHNCTRLHSKLTNNTVYTWRNVFRSTRLEKLCVVILLSNNHHELWVPFLIKEFARLQIKEFAKYLDAKVLIY